MGIRVVPLKRASLCVHNQFVLTEELIGHLNGRPKHAASVSLQVEDKVLHAFLLQIHQSFPQLIHGGLRKAADFDVANALVEHVCRIDAVNGDLVPDNVKRQQVTFSVAFDPDLHHGAFGSF